MESSLHQQLKELYAVNGAMEVTLGDYRIDAIRSDDLGDELIEVQCASLSAIRKKCRALLQRHRLRVVKPIVIRTRIAKCKKAGGKVVSRRLSPKRGSILELFEEMIYFNGIFPHENLTLEVPLLHVEQLRIPRPKKSRWWHKDFRVVDVKLEHIEEKREIRTAQDLLKLLPLPDRFDQFDTATLAAAMDRPRSCAQQVAYVLRKTGAIEQIDRRRQGIIYQRAA